jgi:hypothetical protein
MLITTGIFFRLFSHNNSNQQPHGEREIVIKSPNELNLGSAPRSKYPLVVFFIRHDSDDECMPDETVS